MIILEGEKCRGICKLKEKTQFKENFNDNLGRESTQGGALRKTMTGREPDQNTVEKRNGAIRENLEMAQGMTMNQPKIQGRGARIKASRYG